MKGNRRILGGRGCGRRWAFQLAAGLLAGGTLLAAGGARANDFVDTRLTFLLSDENVLVAPGQTEPSIPGVHVGFPTYQNLQFYDNFDTKYTGFENMSNLTLYKALPSYFEGLDSEAALVITMLDYGSAITIQDQSSYIRLHYRPKAWSGGDKEGFFLTVFPTSSDRMRLGFSYRISWGGDAIFPQGTPPVLGPLLPTTTAPGAKLEFNHANWYAWVASKGTEILDPKISQPTVNYGIMGGVGCDITRKLRLEGNGGYFSQGGNPETDVLDAPVWVAGGSARLSYHVGVPVGTSIDFRLYRNDPLLPQRFFGPEDYPGGWSYSVSLEVTYLRQALRNPDLAGTTSVYPNENGWATKPQAGALWFRSKHNYDRFWALAETRDLSFIEVDQPGFIPYEGNPQDAVVTPELFGAAGWDHNFPRIHVTPGIDIGVEQPASFSSSEVSLGGNNPPIGLSGKHTVVVYDLGEQSVLPPGRGPTPLFSAKGTFRWDISEAFAAVGELYFKIDNNQTTFYSSVAGVAEPVFSTPFDLGFNAVLQARY
ncbi:MAG: hypothetical protein ACYDCL_16610 [Myxococcales bacterium]